ncbi:hypothetical protein EJ07DRAFT_182053 [Lizonia empirigonia]|nr:hypothetical protein EJ07DRAFT_182053 [Lizonia empirigonia]
MAPAQDPIDVPRPKKSVTFGLMVLALFMPWLALYLDGASWQSICLNLAVWLFLPPIGTLAAIIHAIVCLCRTDEHRKYSNPARRRLRYHNEYSASENALAENKAVESEPSPAPVARTVTEPAPAPVSRAVTQGPANMERAPTKPSAPVQRVATEPPAVKSSATSSSTSVSSSDVEEENPPVAAPPPNEDDPFKDPGA